MRRSLQGRRLWMLLAVVGLLLVVAIAVVMVLLSQQRPQSGGWQDPIIAIMPEEIAADLALYPLAGASELDTVDAAIDNGDLETAFATLVFGMDLTDAQRIGRLILLGGLFADAELPERSALALQQIEDTAVLSPDLNDPARADALLASGRGWATLGQDDRALEAYDQLPVAPDIVVVDCMLPGCSGVEVAHEIRHRNPVIPILAYSCSTAFAGAFADVDRCLFLGKPFRVSELLMTVELALSGGDAEPRKQANGL